jgi:hypothetical protein
MKIFAHAVGKLVEALRAKRRFDAFSKLPIPLDKRSSSSTPVIVPAARPGNRSSMSSTSEIDPAGSNGAAGGDGNDPNPSSPTTPAAGSTTNRAAGGNGYAGGVDATDSANNGNGGGCGGGAAGYIHANATISGASAVSPPAS